MPFYQSQHTYTVKTKYLDFSSSEVPDSLLITTGLPQLLKETANTQGYDSDEGWVAKMTKDRQKKRKELTLFVGPLGVRKSIWAVKNRYLS